MVSPQVQSFLIVSGRQNVKCGIASSNFGKIIFYTVFNHVSFLPVSQFLGLVYLINLPRFNQQTLIQH